MNTVNKITFFAIVTIIALTSCAKEPVLGQQVGQDVTTIASPYIVSLGANGATATVNWNGRTFDVNTMHDAVNGAGGDFTGTGFLTAPWTRPGSWGPNDTNTGVIPYNFNYNDNNNAAGETVNYVYGTYTGAGYTYTLRSAYMRFKNIPSSTDCSSAYVLGTFNLKTGWSSVPSINYSDGQWNIGE